MYSNVSIHIWVCLKQGTQNLLESTIFLLKQVKTISAGPIPRSQTHPHCSEREPSYTQGKEQLKIEHFHETISKLLGTNFFPCGKMSHNERMPDGTSFH